MTAFDLPHRAAPWESLTDRVRAVAGDGPYPFDGDPRYEQLFEDIARGLHRRSPRHVLLVGERGVGQHAVMVEVARRAALGSYPFLRETEFVSIDCRHVPSDESRPVLYAILDAAAARSDLVLCLEGVTALTRAGGPMDGRARFLAALARSPFRVIGLVSPYEWAEQFNDDETQEHFSVLDLQEPEPETALRLAGHIADALEQQYEVEIEPAAVERAISLSHGFILNERLPAKAIRILDSVCEDVRFERTQLGATRATVTEDDVVRRVAALSGLPEHTLRGVSDRVDYAAGLREIIVGQDHVVDEVATELSLIKAGLGERGKPASVMMFIGQTGTGKTEMAKALARFYSSSKRLKTFTLGNYSEPHSVSELIGVPPGYVGHDLGGRLINELNADPYGVFLLDEADKPHPDVMQPFLNLFDEGWIYDRRGVKAHADRAMFILTTNVGQRQIAQMTRDGKSIAEITEKMKATLTQIRHSKSNRPVFTPEFLARIGRIIVFRSLDRDAMRGIAERQVRRMQQEWQARRDKTLVVDDAVIQAIAAEAHERNEASQGKEGGRVVRKLLADRLESAIQRAISDDPEGYRSCGSVSVSADEARWQVRLGGLR